MLTLTQDKKLAPEQKEEWQLTLAAGTNLQEPACSSTQQQAVRNRLRYFLPIKVQLIDDLFYVCFDWIQSSSAGWGQDLTCQEEAQEEYKSQGK